MGRLNNKQEPAYEDDKQFNKGVLIHSIYGSSKSTGAFDLEKLSILGGIITVPRIKSLLC